MLGSSLASWRVRHLCIFTCVYVYIYTCIYVYSKDTYTFIYIWRVEFRSMAHHHDVDHTKMGETSSICIYIHFTSILIVQIY